MTDIFGTVHQGVYIQPCLYDNIKDTLKRPPLDTCIILSRSGRSENFKRHHLSLQEVHQSALYKKSVL